MPLVKDSTIERSSLHAVLPTHLRLDVLPFCFLHVAVLAYILVLATYQWWFPVLPACSVFVHAVAFLLGHWSISVRCALRYRSVKDVTQASHVMVQPKLHCGSANVIPILEARNSKVWL